MHTCHLSCVAIEMTFTKPVRHVFHSNYFKMQHKVRTLLKPLYKRYYLFSFHQLMPYEFRQTLDTCYLSSNNTLAVFHLFSIYFIDKKIYQYIFSNSQVQWLYCAQELLVPAEKFTTRMPMIGLELTNPQLQKFKFSTAFVVKTLESIITST